jgi:hypothetical protein
MRTRTTKATNGAAVLEAPPAAIDARSTLELEQALDEAELNDDQATITAIEAELDSRQRDRRSTERRARAAARREQEQHAVALREKRDAARLAYDDEVRALVAHGAKIDELVTALVAEEKAVQHHAKRAYGHAHAAGYLLPQILNRLPRVVNAIAHRLVHEPGLRASIVDLSNAGNAWRRDEQGRWLPCEELLRLGALKPSGTEEV